MKVSQQDVYLGAHLGSVSTAGRGRKLDGAEGEAELQCTPTWASATGKFGATVALQSCPKWDKGARLLSHCVGQWIWATPGRR